MSPIGNLTVRLYDVLEFKGKKKKKKSNERKKETAIGMVNILLESAKMKIRVGSCRSNKRKMDEQTWYPFQAPV